MEKTLPPPPQVNQEEHPALLEKYLADTDPTDLIVRERTQEAGEFSKIWVKRKPRGRRDCNAWVSVWNTARAAWWFGTSGTLIATWVRSGMLPRKSMPGLRPRPATRWTASAYEVRDGRISSDPGHALNVVEQINQTWTFVVALAAARHLLEMHPEAGGYVLAPGAHAAIELDIMSEAPGWWARKLSLRSIRRTIRSWRWIYRNWLPGPKSIATYSLCRRVSLASRGSRNGSATVFRCGP